MRTEIFKSLVALLRKAFPELPVYIGDTPEGFDRPSILIEEDGGSYDPEHTCQTGENVLNLTVVLFWVLTGGYRTEDQLELLTMQQTVTDLLAGGRLEAGGRSIRVAGSFGGEIPGGAYGGLTMRGSSEARERAEDEPLMMEVHTRNN